MGGSDEANESNDSGKPLTSLLYDCVPNGELTSEFLKRSTAFLLAPDGILFRQGDAANGVFFLRSGSVMLSMQSGGKPILHARAEVGSLLGLPSAISGKPYSMSAVACSEAQIEHLKLDSFRELTQSRPDLLINVVKILANEVRAVRLAIIEVLEQNR